MNPYSEAVPVLERLINQATTDRLPWAYIDTLTHARDTTIAHAEKETET